MIVPMERIDAVKEALWKSMKAKLPTLTREMFEAQWKAMEPGIVKGLEAKLKPEEPESVETIMRRIEGGIDAKLSTDIEEVNAKLKRFGEESYLKEKSDERHELLSSVARQIFDGRLKLARAIEMLNERLKEQLEEAQHVLEDARYKRRQAMLHGQYPGFYHRAWEAPLSEMRRILREIETRDDADFWEHVLKALYPEDNVLGGSQIWTKHRDDFMAQLERRYSEMIRVAQLRGERIPPEVLKELPSLPAVEAPAPKEVAPAPALPPPPGCPVSPNHVHRKATKIWMWSKFWDRNPNQGSIERWGIITDPTHVSGMFVKEPAKAFYGEVAACFTFTLPSVDDVVEKIGPTKRGDARFVLIKNTVIDVAYLQAVVSAVLGKYQAGAELVMGLVEEKLHPITFFFQVEGDYLIAFIAPAIPPEERAKPPMRAYDIEIGQVREIYADDLWPLSKKVARKPAPRPYPQKLPWDMTRLEFIEQVPHNITFSGPDSYYHRPKAWGSGRRTLWAGTRSKQQVIEAQHKFEVRMALQAGKALPPDVLTDYPDLVQKPEPEVEIASPSAQFDEMRAKVEAIGYGTPEQLWAADEAYALFSSLPEDEQEARWSMHYKDIWNLARKRWMEAKLEAEQPPRIELTPSGQKEIWEYTRDEWIDLNFATRKEKAINERIVEMPAMIVDAKAELAKAIGARKPRVTKQYERYLAKLQSEQALLQRERKFLNEDEMDKHVRLNLYIEHHNAIEMATKAGKPVPQRVLDSDKVDFFHLKMVPVFGARPREEPPTAPEPAKPAVAYRYYLRNRPPTLGAIPNSRLDDEVLVNIVIKEEAYQRKPRAELGGEPAYGPVFYGEPLSAKDIDGYELILGGTINRATGEEITPAPRPAPEVVPEEPSEVTPTPDGRWISGVWYDDATERFVVTLDRLESAKRLADELPTKIGMALREAQHPSHSPERQAEFKKMAENDRARLEDLKAQIASIELPTSAPAESETLVPRERIEAVKEALWKSMVAKLPTLKRPMFEEQWILLEPGIIKGLEAKLKPAPPPAPREPWQMTRGEFRASYGHSPIERHIACDADHEGAVADALAEGKPVPPTVMADYPDLAKRIGLEKPEAPPPSQEPAITMPEEKPGDKRPWEMPFVEVREKLLALSMEDEANRNAELLRALYPEEGTSTPYRIWQKHNRDFGMEIGGRHKTMVKRFMDEGKPIPENVRADWPALAKAEFKVPKRRASPFEVAYGRLNEVIPELKEHLEGGSTHAVGKAHGFMGLHIDVLRKDEQGRWIISLAHNYIQEGDAMADPDMEVRIDFEQKAVVAMTFQQDPGIYQRAVEFDEQGKELIRPKLVKDLIAFLNQWLKNIKEQGHKVVWDVEEAPEPKPTELTPPPMPPPEPPKPDEPVKPTGSIEDLEKQVGDDPAKNNELALEMVKRPDFSRDRVNELYNGLGAAVEMGVEGTYGKGIIRKRAVTLQQFYTSSAVSDLIVRALGIPGTARVYDPTCGSGRLFWRMPNQSMCHGVEVETDAFRIAKALYPGAQLIQDDTMLHMHPDAFDYVIGNPPFTLYWEDTNRLFQNAGHNNTLVSELAVLEIATRSVRDGGFIALVMPSNVWEAKIAENLAFVEWFKSRVLPFARILLPSTTHEGTTYPVALYLFKRRSGYWSSKYAPEFRYGSGDEELKLKDFSDAELQRVADIIQDDTDVTTYARKTADRVQEPFALEHEKRLVWNVADYLKSATQVVSKDLVTLDFDPAKLDLLSFRLPPILMIPNGAHADLKLRALQTEHGRKWSPSRKEYVDMFRTYVAQIDGFLDERKTYDDLPLVAGMTARDCKVDHSTQFTESLEKRKEFIKFQAVPFEIWIDTEQDMHWKPLYHDQGYAAKYPEVYSRQLAKWNALQQDPAYMTTLKDGSSVNWLDKLYGYQKHDVLRLSLKRSAIYCAAMGLGKTRQAIADGILKGTERNLIVCPSRLIDVWREEFRNIGMEEPYLVEYADDVPTALQKPWAIIALESLGRAKDRMRPGKRRDNPVGGSGPSDVDVQSAAEVEANLEDFLLGMGYSQAEVDEVMAARMSTRDVRPLVKRNPVRRSKAGVEPVATPEKAQTKEQEQMEKLAKSQMFADNLAKQFEFVVVDEAHYLSNPTTKRTQAVARLDPQQWLFLSGTPVNNRIRGLLSVLVIGWGEETAAQPYTKTKFLEHFQALKTVDIDVIDSHGYKSKKGRQVEIPKIDNPEDMKTLMAGKWLRRNKYEPEVEADVRFPRPDIRYREIEPSKEEKEYSKQWNDEYIRIRQEVASLGEELKRMRDDNVTEGYDEAMQQWKLLIAIAGVMIDKLRAVALAPQVDWLHDKSGGESLLVEGEEDEEEAAGKSRKELEEKAESTLARLIHIEKPYRGGPTPRQLALVEELKTRVKNGELCYTVCKSPSFNRLVLKPLLEKEGIRVDLIDGKVDISDRAAIIDNFMAKKFDVLLATIGTFDTGINIPHASYCALVQPFWNWSESSQAFSRMIRPASRGPRTVDFWVLTSGIEKYVRQLMDMKKVNTEYVLDYGPTPPEMKWVYWGQAVQEMFNDILEGKGNV